MNNKLLFLGLIMSMMCIFWVSCDFLGDIPPPTSNYGKPSPKPPSDESKPKPKPKPRPTSPKPLGPCGTIQTTLGNFMNPGLPRGADIKSKRNRPAKFTTCGDMTGQAHHEIKLEVRQNGRVVGTFYESKNSRHRISLSCDSEIQLSAIATGYDICGLTMTSVGAQLSGVESYSGSTFVNRQNNERNTTSNRDKWCKVELKETLYEPLVILNNAYTNRVEISTCSDANLEMLLFIEYKE